MFMMMVVMLITRQFARCGEWREFAASVWHVCI